MHLARAIRAPIGSHEYQSSRVSEIFVCYLNRQYAVFDSGTNAIYYIDDLGASVYSSPLSHDGTEYYLYGNDVRIKLVRSHDHAVRASVVVPRGSYDGAEVLRCTRVDHEGCSSRLVCVRDTMIVELIIDWTKVK